MHLFLFEEKENIMVLPRFHFTIKVLLLHFSFFLIRNDISLVFEEEEAGMIFLDNSFWAECLFWDGRLIWGVSWLGKILMVCEIFFEDFSLFHMNCLILQPWRFQFLLSPPNQIWASTKFFFSSVFWKLLFFLGLGFTIEDFIHGLSITKMAQIKISQSRT